MLSRPRRDASINCRDIVFLFITGIRTDSTSVFLGELWRQNARKAPKT